MSGFIHFRKPIECRFQVVENPVRMKEIRNYERDGRKPFKYWPGGDSVTTALVDKMARRWKLYSVAKDKLLAREIEVPAKVDNQIEKYKVWLESWGYICMEDFTAEEQRVINDKFWELV